MGTLTEEDKRYLAENLLAFFNRDYRRVAQLHVESGWVPRETRVEEFESAIRTVSEPIFEKPLSEISFGHFLLRLFQTARRFDMEVQPQLVLLQKTLLNIEGLGRQLYPQLDLWTTAKPFLERWMSEQIGRRAFISKLKNNLPSIAEHLPDLPIRLNRIIDEASEGKLAVSLKSEDLQKLHKEIRESNKNTTATIGGSTLLVTGTLFLTLGSNQLITDGLAYILGAGLCTGGSLILIKQLLLLNRDN